MDVILMISKKVHRYQTVVRMKKLIMQSILNTNAHYHKILKPLSKSRKFHALPRQASYFFNRLLLQGKANRPMTAISKQTPQTTEENIEKELLSSRKRLVTAKHTYRATVDKASLPLTKIPQLDAKMTEQQIRTQIISPFMVTSDTKIEHDIEKKRPSSPCICLYRQIY